MRIKVPITGTVLGFDGEAAKLDGHGVTGDPNDLVRIDVDLGNVSWRLVSIDLISGMAEIEVSGEPPALQNAQTRAAQYTRAKTLSVPNEALAKYKAFYQIQE